MGRHQAGDLDDQAMQQSKSLAGAVGNGVPTGAQDIELMARERQRAHQLISA